MIELGLFIVLAAVIIWNSASLGAKSKRDIDSGETRVEEGLDLINILISVAIIGLALFAVASAVIAVAGA